MLALRINEFYLDLDPSATYQLRMDNPIFDRERIERVFSDPFTITLTERNTAALRHAHRLDVKTGKKIENVQLFIGGNQFDVGVALITDRSDRKLEVAFQNDQIEWIAKFKTFRLRSLDIPVVVPNASYFPQIDLTSVIVTEPTPGDRIVAYVELNGNLYDSGALLNADDLVNAINADFPGLASVYNQGVDTISIRLNTAAKPDLQINLIPTLPIISGETATTFYHDPNNQFAEEAVRAAWNAYTPSVVNTPTTHVFPVIEARDFFDNKNPAWEGFVNYYEGNGLYKLNEIGSNLLPGETPLSRGWKYSMVPMPFLSGILDKIFEKAGTTSVTGDFYKDINLQKLIVFNNRSIDKVYHPISFANPTVLFGYVYPPFNGFDNNYNLSNHLPDFTLYEYLIKLSTTFGLLYRVEGGKAFVRTIQGQLGQQTEDWTDRFEPAYRSTPPQYTGYDLDFTERDDESAVPGQLERVTVGTGDDLLTLESQVFSLYNHNINRDDDSIWQVPFYDEGGTSIPLELTETCPVMLLFYWGLQPDSDGNTYPLASHDNRNINNDTLGPYSLNWDGSAGRYEKFWKRYVNLLVKGEPLTKVARLTIDQLMAWRRNPAKPIWCYQPEGSFTAIIKNISVKITLSDTPEKPLKCTLEMIKINV
jgi:hypothetical protein